MSASKIGGYDTFLDESYSLGGKYASQAAAERAARRRLMELEISQPQAMSGGQAQAGIQDRVYIIRPDGTTYRYEPSAWVRPGKLLRGLAREYSG